MRIPLTKIYRAFPELDAFSDEQCERFMKQVAVSGARRVLPGLAFLLVTLLGLVVTCALSGVFFSAMADYKSAAIEQLIVALVWLVAFSAPFISGLIARDILLRRHLRLVINDKLNRIRCLKCRYILIGQTVTHNAVTCPECGSVHELGELGVVEADLIPDLSAGSGIR